MSSFKALRQQNSLTFKNDRARWQIWIRWRIGLVIGFFAILIVDFGLRLFTYRQLCRFLLVVSPQPNPLYADIKRASDFGRLVNQAGIWLPWATCLRRSLATWWLMRWSGIPSEIRIGVKLMPGDNSSHSWVEHHGEVINDAPNIADFYPVNFSDLLEPEKVVRLR
jgi:hypothetical protein